MKNKDEVYAVYECDGSKGVVMGVFSSEKLANTAIRHRIEKVGANGKGEYKIQKFGINQLLIFEPEMI